MIDFTSVAQWCSGIIAAFCAGGTEFNSRSHHKRYLYAGEMALSFAPDIRNRQAAPRFTQLNV